MLKIASYSLRGQVVRVKLKCPCGNGKVFEVLEEGRKYYFCSKCRSRRTLEDLKKEASTYWRGHEWVIECDPDQRVQPRVHVNVSLELVVRATRYSPPFCTLHGRCRVLSESGMLAIVEDFDQRNFHDITTTYRFVEIALAVHAEPLPARLTGRVVGVRFRPDELPTCNFGVAFEDLSGEALDSIRQYVQVRLRDKQALTDFPLPTA